MLITPDEIRKYRPVAINIDDAKRIEIYITEVENLVIIPAIGAPLYKSLIENQSAHTLLLDGGYYNNNKVKFAGLKAAIALLTYARFVLNQPINVTPFGVKEKLGYDSSTVADKSLYRHANEAEKTGLAYLQQCLNYINSSNSACNQVNRITKRKFKAIGS